MKRIATIALALFTLVMMSAEKCDKQPGNNAPVAPGNGPGGVAVVDVNVKWTTDKRPAKRQLEFSLTLPGHPPRDWNEDCCFGKRGFDALAVVVGENKTVSIFVVQHEGGFLSCEIHDRFTTYDYEHINGPGAVKCSYTNRPKRQA